MRAASRVSATHIEEVDCSWLATFLGLRCTSWWSGNVKMYDQREPLKYGSTYLPRQSSNSRRFKNGQRSFMSRPSDFIIVAVIVVATGVASMWFISRLPFFLEGASSFYGWATAITLTWGTPSMWWLFVNLIVGAIVLSSGFVSAFGSNSGTDPYRPVYIEKDIRDPASPGVPLDSSSDIPEDSGESYEEDSFRSYVPPAKPKAAVPIPYTKIQPEYEATAVYEATPVYEAADYTDQRGAEQASRAENVEIHTREIPALINVSEYLPVISEPPTGYPGPFTAEPARSVEGEAIEPELVSSRSVPPVDRGIPSRSTTSPVVFQAEPELVAEVRSGEPEAVLSRSVPSAAVASTDSEEEVVFSKEDKVVADDEFIASFRNLESSDGVTRETEDPPVAYPPASAFYDPFTVIDDAPIGYGKLQRNFTEGAINYVIPDEPLISAPPPKAELVKAHTFTSGRAIRRDQIDSYVEPLARKLEEMKKRDEEMKRRDEINRKAFHAEAVRDDTTRKGFHAESKRTHNRDAPAETMARDTRPAKVHSRNSSIDVTSKDIQHSYPTEVFYPPPVQSLPADIAHYFSSAHQAPPGDAELRQVTPAAPPAVLRPPKKVAPAEGLERSVSKKTPSSEVPERPPSRKIPTGDVLERPPLKKTMPGEAPERMSSARKPSPVEVPERPPTDQVPQAEVLHRPLSKKTTTAETVTVESVPARSSISKKTAALEVLADKLHRPKKAPADGLSDLLQRPPSSKKAPSPGGMERDHPKQSSQTEGMQRPISKQTLPVQIPLQTPVPPPPVIKTSPPPSPPAAATVRKQVSPPPPPPADFSPPTSPPMLRPMPPPPPPHLKIPSPLDVNDPFLGSSSDDTPGFKFYPKDGRNPSPKKEASSIADMPARSAKYAIPVEDVYQAPAPKVSSVRSYRTEPGSSTSQNAEPSEKSRPSQRRTRNRPPPAPEPEPSISDGTESEITEEGKEHDDLHQQIESFLARMHEDMRLQRQESMARNMRIKQEFNHDD